MDSSKLTLGAEVDELLSVLADCIHICNTLRNTCPGVLEALDELQTAIEESRTEIKRFYCSMTDEAGWSLMKRGDSISKAQLYGATSRLVTDVRMKLNDLLDAVRSPSTLDPSKVPSFPKLQILVEINKLEIQQHLVEAAVRMLDGQIARTSATLSSLNE